MSGCLSEVLRAHSCATLPKTTAFGIGQNGFISPHQNSENVKKEYFKKEQAITF